MDWDLDVICGWNFNDPTEWHLNVVLFDLIKWFLPYRKVALSLC